MEKDISTNEILQAINEFSSKTDERFSKVDERFSKVDERFDKIEGDINYIKAVMVTKEDLDVKLENLATKNDIDKIFTAVDGIAKKHKDFETELAANQGAHDRFEGRIKGLEKKQGTTQFA